MRRTLQAGRPSGVGDDLGVEAAGARGVKDADHVVVAAQKAHAVAGEGYAVRCRHLVHRIICSVCRSQLAADRIPQVQRVCLSEHPPTPEWLYPGPGQQVSPT